MTLTAQTLTQSQTENLRLPVVVIGNGPAGLRFCRELRNKQAQQSVVLYGEETHQPYNRIRLSSWLAGDIDWDALFEHNAEEDPLWQLRYGYKIVEINRSARWVRDQQGQIQPYSKLVVATGSRPFIPAIPGNTLSGVYSFRNLDDALGLMARQTSTQHTVVIGGGLLGLEAARGMQKLNTQVTVVELSDRLMSQQLDAAGADTLRDAVMNRDINVILEASVKSINGTQRVESVELSNGRVLYCDTVVIAAGIRPNTDLARAAGLTCPRGIRVNDQMQTSDPDIYAIGECAEHRGEIYGLVGPGLEQANVAAADITQVSGSYSGSQVATRLKVLDTPVFSVGPVGENALSYYGRSLEYRDEEHGIYRKLLIHANRLVGVIGIGDWSEARRVQTAVQNRAIIWPWQRFQFTQQGLLWPNDASDQVSDWPADAIICQCTGINRGQIEAACQQGACTIAKVRDLTGASSVCGSCQPLVQDLLGQKEVEATRFAPFLLFSGLFAALFALAFLLFPAIPYPASVQVDWRWDELWRNTLFKQISGFSILGLFVLGLLVSLRKRFKPMAKVGTFDAWRLLHLLTGSLVVVALLAHTGLRLGHGLNFMLMLSFSLLLLLGALNSTTQALQHQLDRSLVQRLRRHSLWWHIVLFWPVPVLLAFHILKSYWY